MDKTTPKVKVANPSNFLDGPSKKLLTHMCKFSKPWPTRYQMVPNMAAAAAGGPPDPPMIPGPAIHVPQCQEAKTIDKIFKLMFEHQPDVPAGPAAAPAIPEQCLRLPFADSLC